MHHDSAAHALVVRSEGHPSSAPPPSSERPRRKSKQRLSGRSRLTIDKRRAQLLELGQRLFNAYGYDEISIEEIAKFAGISKGLLYHYFPSKREFYSEVTRQGASDLLISAGGTSELDVLELVTGRLDEYLDRVQSSLETAASTEALYESVAGSSRELRQDFAMRVLRVLPRRDSLLRNALCGWVGFVEGVVVDWLEHRDVSRTDLRALVVDAAYRSILFARGATRSSSVPFAGG